MISTPILETKTEIEETLYCDYNSALGETTQTAIISKKVTTTTDEGVTDVTGPTRTYWQLTPGATEKITEPASIVFYEEEGGTLKSITTVALQAATSTEALKFTFETEDGITATVTFTAKTTLNTTTHYYEFSGYDVEVVDENGTALEVTGVGATIGTSGGIQTITLTVSGITYVFRFNPPSA